MISASDPMVKNRLFVFASRKRLMFLDTIRTFDRIYGTTTY